MDHSHDTARQGPWAGGWLIASLAGLFTVLIARGIGEVGTVPAVLVGSLSFLVHGALLGTGGVERSETLGEDHAHDHGHH